MRKADAQTMALRILTPLVAAVLPWILHPAVLIAVLFLTPVLCACMRAAGWGGQGTAMAAVLTLSAWMAGHAVQVCQLAGLWCLVTFLMERVLARRGHRRNVKDWTVFSVIILCAAVVMLRAYYGGNVTGGMAEGITAWIAGLKNADQVLLAMYEFGFARLEDEHAQLLASGMLGAIRMHPQLQLELVNSLRTTLRYLLDEQLLEWVTVALITQVLLTAVLPEMIRRRLGEEAELEPVHRLHMNRRQARNVLMLMLFGLVRLFTSGLAVYQAAGMAMTAFSVLYSAQGVCLLVWWLRKGVYTRGSWIAPALLVLLLLPAVGTVLTLLGIFDQIADPRKLREKDIKDIEGGT